MTVHIGRIGLCNREHWHVRLRDTANGLLPGEMWIHRDDPEKVAFYVGYPLWEAGR